MSEENTAAGGTSPADVTDHPILKGDPVPEVDPVLELRRAAHLLLAQNPNHFGNLESSDLAGELKIVGDTSFERLTCVGLNPELDVLEATVQILRPSGYNGGLCTSGSTEWVRFFISYDDSATWSDVGLSSFNAHDIPDGTDCGRNATKPLSYTVAFPLQNPNRDWCARPVLPVVRAILSWQVQPPAGQPNWNPIWGDHLDHHVQIKPRELFLGDILGSLSVKAESLPTYWQPLLTHPVPNPEPEPVTLANVAELVKAGLPVHRAASTLLAHAVSTSPPAQEVQLATIAQSKELGIDWADALKAFLVGEGDTTYEQLDCLGLDYNRDLLVGTLDIKLASGFSGPPCSAGSREYVSFWVDYDNTCQWTYLNTASVTVHDYDPIPADGLSYWVAVPAQTADHAQQCSEPKVGRIRAVLSWATPPSTTDPYLMPRWGNAVEAHIEIPPRTVTSDSPAIGTLGGIHIVDIDTAVTGLTLPDATFAHWGSPADRWVSSRQCPFAGVIEVTAPVPASFAAAMRQYRLRYRAAGDSSTGTPITDSFNTDDLNFTTTRTPDPVTGLVPYLDPSLNIYSVLGRWETFDKVVDGIYEISLEMTDSLGSPIGATPWLRVKVDNTKPVATISQSGSQPCNKVNPGDTVSGPFVATDAYFGAYSLDTLPASLNPPPPSHIPLSTTDPVPAGTWSLVTNGDWAQCGYVVQLWVYNRAIVDSVPWESNSSYGDTGFCLGL